MPPSACHAAPLRRRDFRLRAALFRCRRRQRYDAASSRFSLPRSAVSRLRRYIILMPLRRCHAAIRARFHVFSASHFAITPFRRRRRRRRAAAFQFRRYCRPFSIYAPRDCQP